MVLQSDVFLPALALLASQCESAKCESSGYGVTELRLWCYRVTLMVSTRAVVFHRYSHCWRLQSVRVTVMVF
jgi:hypothetical protein